MDPVNTQIADALILAKADTAIDQLENLQKRLEDPLVESIRAALKNASDLIREMKASALENTKTGDNGSPRIFYSTEKDKRPTFDIADHTANMRTGKPREIKRFVEISSVWAIRVNDEKNWHDRFRIVDSLQAAHAMKVLHNV